jgi:hypothetical protein
MANSPMTTLSIGGVLLNSGFGAREHQNYETILRLKSWNQDPEPANTDDMQTDVHLPGMMEPNGHGSRSQNSCKGLKRKRPDHHGVLQTCHAYDGMESRIVLGLGHGDDASSVDEDSDVVLGLGQSEAGNYSGNLSGSANLCGSNGGDETVHSGQTAAERLMADGLDRNAAEPGVLLRLGSSGDPLARGEGSGGQGRSGHDRLFNNHIEKHAGSHLGLAPSYSGYVQVFESPNGREYRGGGPLSGLGHGDKSVERRDFPGKGGLVPVVDEGSTTARLSCGGYMPSLLMGSQIYPTAASDRHHRDPYGKKHMEEGLVEHDLLMGLRASTSGGTTSTSGASGNSERAPKVCKFRGCGKGPRGASGLCIAHGGGRRSVYTLNSETYSLISFNAYTVFLRVQ